MNLFHELKRRNVFRVAGLYSVTAWLLVQIIVTVKDPLHLPAWTDTLALVLMLAGFPITLLFAWAFEMTPEGLKLTKEVPEDQSIAARTGRRLDYATLGGLALVLVVIAADRLAPRRGASEEAAAATGAAIAGTSAPAADKSIAVLPFQNRSAKDDDVYFTEGMHDDLLTQLSKVAALRVISRTSVVQYADTDKTVPEIAKELGVAMVLEGAVQRAGDRIRINVQLIDGSSDEHLWAETYDREMTVANVLDIQTDITETIAGALKAVITSDEKAAIAALPTQSTSAYDAFLRGKAIMAQDTRDVDRLNQAVAAFDEAIRYDPQFADAHARKAVALLGLVWWNEGSGANLARAEEALARARALAPDSIETKIAEGNYLYRGKTDFKSALTVFRPLAAAAPNNADLQFYVALAERRVGDNLKAIKSLERAARLSPLDAVYATTLAQTYDNVGAWRKAEAAIARAKALAPDSSYTQVVEFQLFWTLGDAELNWRYYVDLRASPDADTATIDELFLSAIVAFMRDPDRIAIAADRLAALGDDDNAVLRGMTVARVEALLRLGRADEARALAEKTLARLDKIDRTAADEGNTLFVRMVSNSFLGRREETIAAADAILTHAESDNLVLLEFGDEIVRSMLRVGETDRAFEAMEQIYSFYSIGQFGSVLIDVELDGIRDDPRYKAMETRYREWRRREGLD